MSIEIVQYPLLNLRFIDYIADKGRISIKPGINLVSELYYKPLTFDKTVEEWIFLLI